MRNNKKILLVAVVILLTTSSLFFIINYTNLTIWGRSTYTDSTYNFSVTLPSSLITTYQNKSEDYGDILIYDKDLDKDGSISSSKNPLLAIPDNVSFLVLTINGSLFIEGRDFSLRDFISQPVYMPATAAGDVDVTLTQWEKVPSDDGKTDLYFYTKEIGTPNKIIRRGIAWVSNGKLFTLENYGKPNPDNILYMKIAKSFSTIK